MLKNDVTSHLYLSSDDEKSDNDDNNQESPTENGE